MKPEKQEPISNVVLALLALFALGTVAGLGFLLHSARARTVVAQKEIVALTPGKPDTRGVAQTAVEAGENEFPMLRIAARSGTNDVATVTEALAPASPPAAAKIETAAPEPVPVVSVVAAEPAAPIASVAKNLAMAQPEGSNELVGEITGVSYTTKKLISSGMDPNNTAGAAGKNPGGKKPGAPLKPGTPKPPDVLVPSTKPVPPKTEAPKSAVPALPPLPVGAGKVDFSHSPIYVLTDGRRLRAVLVRETNGVISIRNEAGAEISFKKIDVKEIIKN